MNLWKTFLKKNGDNQTYNKKNRSNLLSETVSQDEGGHIWFKPYKHCNFKKDGSPHWNPFCKSSR